MEVQFVCPEGSDLAALEQAYPDLYHEDTYDGWETYWIGNEGEHYWDSERKGFDYADGDGPVCDQRDTDKEWMTYEEAVEFCGFAETLIPGSDTLLEGNGPWAQGQLRKEEHYQRGAEKARALMGGKEGA